MPNLDDYTNPDNQDEVPPIAQTPTRWGEDPEIDNIGLILLRKDNDPKTLEWLERVLKKHKTYV